MQLKQDGTGPSHEAVTSRPLLWPDYVHRLCPIHRSLSCCGREPLPKPKLIRLGVQRIEDLHHPRGYRELRSPAEMRKLMNRKMVEQKNLRPICDEEFTSYGGIVPDHKEPKGMGGHGETIIRTISRQHIGGVTKKKDRAGWNDLRPIIRPRELVFSDLPSAQ